MTSFKENLFIIAIVFSFVNPTLAAQKYKFLSWEEFSKLNANQKSQFISEFRGFVKRQEEHYFIKESASLNVQNRFPFTFLNAAEAAEPFQDISGRCLYNSSTGLGFTSNLTPAAASLVSAGRNMCLMGGNLVCMSISSSGQLLCKRNNHLRAIARDGDCNGPAICKSPFYQPKGATEIKTSGGICTTATTGTVSNECDSLSKSPSEIAQMLEQLKKENPEKFEEIRDDFINSTDEVAKYCENAHAFDIKDCELFLDRVKKINAAAELHSTQPRASLADGSVVCDVVINPYEGFSFPKTELNLTINSSRTGDGESTFVTRLARGNHSWELLNEDHSGAPLQTKTSESFYSAENDYPYYVIVQEKVKEGNTEDNDVQIALSFDRDLEKCSVDRTILATSKLDSEGLCSVDLQDYKLRFKGGDFELKKNGKPVPVTLSYSNFQYGNPNDIVPTNIAIKDKKCVLTGRNFDKEITVDIVDKKCKASISNFSWEFDLTSATAQIQPSAGQASKVSFSTEIKIANKYFQFSAEDNKCKFATNSKISAVRKHKLLNHKTKSQRN